MLVEVQALAAKAGFGTPQRVAGGYDARRLALLLAVLDKRAGLSFANLDVFVNVVGGVRMQEPAGDLAVAAALASSVYDKALPADAVFIGEVGLGGEIRAVSQVERRIAEAEKMGMTIAYVGERSVPQARAASPFASRACRRSPTCSSGSFDERARRRRGDRRGGREHAHDGARTRRSSSSCAGWRASRCCCTRCRRFSSARTSRWSCACCRSRTPAIRRRGFFSATSSAC